MSPVPGADHGSPRGGGHFSEKASSSSEHQEGQPEHRSGGLEVTLAIELESGKEEDRSQVRDDKRDPHGLIIIVEIAGESLRKHSPRLRVVGMAAKHALEDPLVFAPGGSPDRGSHL